jgi:tellurite resistance protein
MDGPMKRLLRRRGSTASGTVGAHDYHLAALRLQLLVAMAASDGRVLPIEVDKVAGVVDESKLDAESVERLEQLLRMLLDSPPTIEQVIGRIKEQVPQRKVAEELVRELVYVGRLDDVIDDREEDMLRLVCGAFGLQPTTLHRDRRGEPLSARERRQLDELLAAVQPG